MFKRVVAILGFIFLAGCSTFSSDSNLTPPSPLVEFTPTINVTQQWSIQATNGTSKNYLRLNPVISGDTIFVDDYEGNVVAINRQTGAVQWKIRVGDDITSGIAADKSNIYLVTDDGQLYAFNQQNGGMVWESPVSNQALATPTVVDGMVLVKSIDGVLSAYSATSGRRLWQFSQTEPELTLHISSSAVVAGSYAVAGFANGNLSVVNRITGRGLWSRPIAIPTGSSDIDRMVDIDMSPIVVNGVVYVATYQGYIAALDLQTGRIIWRHKISSYSGLTADRSQLYISDALGYCWSFSLNSGAVRWRQTKLKGRNLTEPVLMGSNMVVADGYGYVHWLSISSGRFTARMPVGDAVYVAPVVSGSNLYVYTENGQLIAFHQG